MYQGVSRVSVDNTVWTAIVAPADGNFCAFVNIDGKDMLVRLNPSDINTQWNLAGGIQETISSPFLPPDPRFSAQRTRFVKNEVLAHVQQVIVGTSTVVLKVLI